VGESEGGLFNVIAPIYNLFFNYQVKYYEKILARVKNEIDVSQYESIIDIGCGTGALSQVLYEEGLKVTGIDAAQKMIKQAKKRLNKDINLVHASALEPIPFEDKSFDIAISSYVIHGMKGYERQKAYAQMSRIAKHRVIVHDYNANRAIPTDLVEWLEGGDYFNFIKNAKAEMAQSFEEVQVINVGTRAAWYICTPQ